MNRLRRGKVLEASTSQKTWKGSEGLVAEENEEGQTEFCVGLTCDMTAITNAPFRPRK